MNMPQVKESWWAMPPQMANSGVHDSGNTAGHGLMTFAEGWVLGGWCLVLHLVPVLCDCSLMKMDHCTTQVFAFCRWGSPLCWQWKEKRREASNWGVAMPQWNRVGICCLVVFYLTPFYFIALGLNHCFLPWMPPMCMGGRADNTFVLHWSKIQALCSQKDRVHLLLSCYRSAVCMMCLWFIRCEPVLSPFPARPWVWGYRVHSPRPKDCLLLPWAQKSSGSWKGCLHKLSSWHWWGTFLIYLCCHSIVW